MPYEETLISVHEQFNRISELRIKGLGRQRQREKRWVDVEVKDCQNDLLHKNSSGEYLTRDCVDLAGKCCGSDGSPLTLMPHQVDGAHWLAEKGKGMLFWEPGTGKTATALEAVRLLDGFPVLIICPNTAKHVWLEESQRWLNGKETVAVTGKRKVEEHCTQHAAGDHQRAQVVIVNYDMVGKWSECLKEFGFEVMILDESHHVKEEKLSKATRAVMDVSAGIPNRFLLTGTPLVNRVYDLYNQIQLVDRFEVFGGEQAFKDHFCQRRGIGRYKHWGNGENLLELHELGKENVWIRTKKDEIGSLPGKSERRIVEVELDNREIYEQIERSPLKWIRENEGIEAYRRASNNEYLATIDRLKKYVNKAKLDAAKEYIRRFLDDIPDTMFDDEFYRGSPDDKLVVFSGIIDIQKSLLEEFKKKALHILGEDKPIERAEAVRRFQIEPESRLIICSIDVAGEAITLNKSHHCLFIDLSWTNARHTQAEDRLDRIGQEQRVERSYLLVKDSIDTWIWNEKIEVKRQLGSLVLDGYADAHAEEGLTLEPYLTKAARFLREGKLLR